MYVVHGSYFNNNFGDTLLIKLMCDELASLVGKKNVFLATKGNKSEQILIGYPVLPKNRRLEVQYLIYAGGGYFGEPPASGLRLFKWYIRNYIRHVIWLTDFKKAKIGVFGVGYGPLSLPLLRKALNIPLTKAQVILFRDKESLSGFNNYNKKSNVKRDICTDFALSVKPLSNKRQKIIALHLPKVSIENVKKILEAIKESSYSSFDIDFISDGDGDFSTKYVSSIDNILYELEMKNTLRFTTYTDIDELINRLSIYSFVITSKLHVGIVTIALGGKVISLPWHSKTIRLYRQLGVENFCLPLQDFKKHSLKEIIENIEKFKPNRQYIDFGIEKIRASIKELIK